MSTMTMDFSDLFIMNVDGDLDDGIPGLSRTDAATVIWIRRLIRSREGGDLEVPAVAWLIARMLCSGGVLVWLAQDKKLLASGFSDILAEAHTHVPEPWAGFLRWASIPSNLEVFDGWPPYRSDDNFDGPHGRPPRRRRRV